MISMKASVHFSPHYIRDVNDIYVESIDVCANQV